MYIIIILLFIVIAVALFNKVQDSNTQEESSEGTDFLLKKYETTSGTLMQNINSKFYKTNKEPLGEIYNTDIIGVTTIERTKDYCLRFVRSSDSKRIYEISEMENGSIVVEKNGEKAYWTLSRFLVLSDEQLEAITTPEKAHLISYDGRYEADVYKKGGKVYLEITKKQ